jgi:hypothetical protein
MRNLHFILCLTFLALFTNYLPAQDNSFEQRIGWRGNQVELHTVTDKAKKQSCTFVASYDSIRAFVTGDQLQLIKHFGIVRLPNEKILGGFFHEDRVFMFTETNGYDELHRWEFDLATGNATQKFIPFDLKKEKVVDRISGGDHFLYFTVDKKTSEFIIYDFNNADEYSTLRYHFGDGIWNDLTDAGLFKRSIDVEKVDLEGECSLDVAVNKNKIYLQSDTLFLVMNNHLDSTQVFSFDLHGKKVDPSLIKHGSGAPALPGASTAYNSFLLRGRLYYVRATLDNLYLEVVDVRDGTTIKTFVAEKDDSIYFKNTPIIQEGSVYSGNTSRELGKTRQLLRKMINGDAVITATPDSNGLVKLMIGSFAKISGGRGGGGMTYIPGAGPGLSGGMWVPAGGFSRSTWTKSARFITLLNGNTYEHVNGDAGWSINERIEKYTEEIKIPPQAENLFMMNGHYYYAFYDKTDRRLVIIEF